MLIVMKKANERTSCITLSSATVRHAVSEIQRGFETLMLALRSIQQSVTLRPLQSTDAHLRPYAHARGHIHNILLEYIVVSVISSGGVVLPVLS